MRTNDKLVNSVFNERLEYKMKNKKTLRFVLIYIAVIGIYIFLFSSQKNILAGVVSSLVVFLFNIISILQTKIIAKSVDIRTENADIENIPFAREFQPAPQLGLVALFFIFIAVIIWDWREYLPNSTKIIGTIFYGGMIIIIIISLVFQKLILANDGIKYFNGFGKVEFPWKNAIEIVKTGSGNNMMIARDVSYSGLWKRKISKYEVPLSFFDKNWRTGEIGKIIEQNAHLEFIDK